MTKTEIKVRLTFTMPVLGSLPGNKELLKTYVAGQAPTLAMAEEEIASVQDQIEKGTTVFAKDETSVWLWNYQVMGFIKNAIGTLIELGDITALSKWQYKKAVDSFVQVHPRRVCFRNPDGSAVTQVGAAVERPLRAEPMQGDRVAIARSESVPEGCSIEFSVRLLQGSNEKSKTAVLTPDNIRAALDYGAFKGIGQWRGAGYGQFTWEELKS